MRRIFCAVLALALALMLAACRNNTHTPNVNNGGSTAAPQPPAGPVVTPPPSAPQRPDADDYALRELLVEGEVKDETDGTVVAQYRHQLYTMEPLVSDRPELTKLAEAFNARTEELKRSMEESGEALGQDARMAREQGYEGPVYAEETVTTAMVMGDLISLKMEGYGYAGGAHPNVWTSSDLFDLRQGVYIDPVEVADDPELFRATVTDQLLDRIAGLDEEIRLGYFTGYEDVVARWNEYCAAFTEEGLEITFSTYELGPYALGPQVFLLSYEDLTDALGENGTVRLGLRAPGS